MISDNNQNASIPPVKEENHLDRRTLWVLLVGIFLVSFSLLTFEITLIRVLSVMLSYHYVFIVISLALLGLGAGGIFVYLFRRRIPQGNSRFASEKIPGVIAAVSLAVVAALLIYAFSLPFILEQLLGLGLAVRLLATAVMLTPLGFIMGFIAGGDTNVKVTNMVGANNIKA